VDFALSDEQQMTRDMVRAFADDRVAPGAAVRDRTGEFPHDLMREIGELGLLGMCVPEEYGGAGMDVLSYLLAVEELARADASVAVTMSVTNSVCCWPILSFGDEQLKRRYLPELATGEVLGGFMLTEPHAGSDAAALKTRYVDDGDSWVLDGSKAWITNGGVGRYFVCLATKDPDLGIDGISAFVLDGRDQGVEFHKPEEKMGLRASKTCMVSLEGARVPKEALIGAEGKGFRIALATLDHSRLGIAAQAVGIAQAAMNEALRYGRDREQFGKPIIHHQAIAFRLAEMDTELSAARALLYQAAWASTQPGRHSRESARSKLYASEMCNRVVEWAVQVHGGYGYSREYTVERLYRDARVTTIYEGSSEVQKMVIARYLQDVAKNL
jgi:alkylation response protein AidB-like acyl-CoA dehydrogenase